ncbi:Stp1/IreP family PP2C-type Ser/Thr phosphatase [Lentilactobacillus laojiaonis]|uniref:Stp1/IreP family PP2C-type Ser/Thr phosphatase n=1 Tax=Lentilactobacillus laojiaonis TaxID=2883998 RepID=UPI001D0BA09F|nr:Stp1/IreP family PP2C-type Ser/Thr phosphatase [Lentilactobacillus laojiaonis]UDM32650.1 Stp1/IreP family PP2C-type Ser/Thr phosphatase [Lentilactobacillus laojiaonis]
MRIAYQSSKGRVRDKNEDNVGTFKNASNTILAVIADGIGGNNAGEIASKMAVNHIGRKFEKTSFTSPEELQSWFGYQLESENSAIIDEANADANLYGMGTTMVAAAVKDYNSLILNIGDSRAYAFHDNKLTQITEDHSYVNELVKHGDITKAEAQNNPYKNIITKSLGINRDATADFRIYNAEIGDQLLLCTDGLTNMVSDEKIAQTLALEIPLIDKCNILVDLANENGGKDNITVLIMQKDSEVNADE